MPRQDPGREFNSQLVPLFLSRLRALGGEPAPLIRAFGFPEDVEQQSVVPIPVRIFWRFCEAVAEAVGDASFGVTFAQGLERGTYGLIEFAGRSAASVGDAFQALLRFQRLINDAVRFSLEVQGAQATFEHRFPGEPLCVGRHGNEYTVVLVTRMVRQLSGTAWKPDRVWLAHPRPPDTSALEAFFEGTPLTFDAGANGLSFAASTLALPVVSADAPLHSLLTQHAERALPTEPPAEDWLARVRLKTREALGAGGGTLERVARALKMSPRTLQRRLSEHGTSFQDVLDVERQELARRLLEDPQLSVSEVAWRLGYSELAAFNRAFKRWTGKTPGEWRAR
jgi:AraC-like DNA-binding protein